MINWKPDVEEHDYPAAHSYLSLAFHPSDSDKIIHALKNGDERAVTRSIDPLKLADFDNESDSDTSKTWRSVES